MNSELHAGHGCPQSVNALAFSETVHCLTGCAIGEVLGMVIGTALDFSDLATIALSPGAMEATLSDIGFWPRSPWRC